MKRTRSKKSRDTVPLNAILHFRKYLEFEGTVATKLHHVVLRVFTVKGAHDAAPPCLGQQEKNFRGIEVTNSCCVGLSYCRGRICHDLREMVSND
jgi:hypothetical protein